MAWNATGMQRLEMMDAANIPANILLTREIQPAYKFKRFHGNGTITRAGELQTASVPTLPVGFPAISSFAASVQGRRRSLNSSPGSRSAGKIANMAPGLPIQHFSAMGFFKNIRLRIKPPCAADGSRRSVSFARRAVSEKGVSRRMEIAR
ncbi:MAG: hypothetical protein WAN72_01245 [Candidatus Acidiferrales bacterium]